MSINLMPHNQIAYDKLKEMFETENRAAIIHPTGTGKGRIARKLMEDNQDKKIIYLSPSLAINEQLEEDLKKYGISSENVEILTYQKLQKMTRAEIKKLMADYIILDEFHHCGATEWGKVVNELLKTHEVSKVLGLSATPIRYTQRGIRDMAEEIFENNIASEMALEEAVANGILKEPQYVTSLYEYGEIVSELEKRISEYSADNSIKSNRKEIAEQELKVLKKYLEKAVTSLPDLLASSMPNKNGKYIVFCSSIDDLKRKVKSAPALFKKVNSNVKVLQVSSDDSDYKKNKETIREFSSNSNPKSLKLLFCVNMLNEGFHLKDIDGGIMMRATTSPTLYTQQLGRIISAGKDSDTVLIDLVNNIDAIETIVKFYEGLSRARGNSAKDKKIKNFAMSKELRDIREIIAKINGLTSRRANNIEANISNILGVSFEVAKALIEKYEPVLEYGMKNGYNGNEVLDETATLNLFTKFRNSRLKFRNEIEVDTPEYIKHEREMLKYREELIVGNMGLVKWMLEEIPELRDVSGEAEDKEQIAMKYLIKAVDSYNPNLRTRNNSAIKFDQYLLTFIRFGLEKETDEYSIEKARREIDEITDQLTVYLGKRPTEQMLVEEIYARTANAVENKDTLLIKNSPILSEVREIIEKIRKKTLAEEKKYNGYSFRAKQITIELVEQIAWEKCYGVRIDDQDSENGWMPEASTRNFLDRNIWYSSYNKIMDAINEKIKEIYRSDVTLNRSYEEITDLDINVDELDDGEFLDYTSENYILDGAYVDLTEPNLRTVEGTNAYTEEERINERNELKDQLAKVLDKFISPEHAEFLRKVAGLDGNGGEEVTYEQWAKRLGIHKATVSERYKRYTRSLRGRRIKGYLIDYYQEESENSFNARKDRSSVNYYHSIRELKNLRDIATGELESVYLSQIIENENLYKVLNESGFSNLKELVNMTEIGLSDALEGDTETVDAVKALLTNFGLELSEEEVIEYEDEESGNKPSKAEFVKGLVRIHKAQTEEIRDLEMQLEASKGREDD